MYTNITLKNIFIKHIHFKIILAYLKLSINFTHKTVLIYCMLIAKVKMTLRKIHVHLNSTKVSISFNLTNTVSDFVFG